MSFPGPIALLKRRTISVKRIEIYHITKTKDRQTSCYFYTFTMIIWLFYKSKCMLEETKNIPKIWREFTFLEKMHIFDKFQQNCILTCTLILIFLKAKFFYIQGQSVCMSVRHGQLALFVNLNRLELSYRFQTLHGYSCSS